MKLFSLSLLSLVALFASLTVLAEDLGVAWKSVPAPVQKALRDRYPIPEIIAIDKEDEGGSITYEFELKENGHEFVAEFTDKGQFVKQEDEIAEKDVPEKVIKPLRAKYAKAKIKLIERVINGEGDKATTTFEFHIEVGKESRAIEIDGDGKILTDEVVESKK